LQQFADSTNDERELLPKPSTLGKKNAGKSDQSPIKAGRPQARHEKDKCTEEMLRYTAM
jgi:hypothetical protein